MQGRLLEKRHSAKQNEHFRSILIENKVEHPHRDGNESFNIKFQHKIKNVPIDSKLFNIGLVQRMAIIGFSSCGSRPIKIICLIIQP